MALGRAELEALAAADGRYAYEAYEFLCHALMHTQERLGRLPVSEEEGSEPTAPHRHVTGQELMEGVRCLAADYFGMMTPVVFRLWGIHSTSDFGKMVYRLIDAHFWNCSPSDRIEDFDDCFDFQRAFVDDFEMVWDES